MAAQVESPLPDAGKDRIRLVLMCQHLTMGGAEELVLGVATHLPKDRYDVRVVCLTAEGIIAQELRQSGIHVDVLPGEPGPRDPRAFARLVGYLRSWRPHVVHTFLLNACLYGRLAAIVAGVPRILAAEQNVYLRKARKHALMERFLAQRTYRVVACCEAVSAFYQRQVGLGPGRMAVILNAVRYDQFLPLPDPNASRAALGIEVDRPTIGVIGRLTRQKGQDVLFRSVAMARGCLPNLQVVVAGQGEERAALERLVNELGIQQQVRFVGVRRDREYLYGALDAFVLPSRWEGLSLALAEAVGAGVPTVATNVGGNAEVIEAGKTGLLVPPDDPQALGGALMRLLQDDALRSALRSRGIAEVRPRFGIEQHVAQLDALYTQALGI